MSCKGGGMGHSGVAVKGGASPPKVLIYFKILLTHEIARGVLTQGRQNDNLHLPKTYRLRMHLFLTTIYEVSIITGPIF